MLQFINYYIPSRFQLTLAAFPGSAWKRGAVRRSNSKEKEFLGSFIVQHPILKTLAKMPDRL